MSIIAEFTVESEDFALAHSLAAAPEMIVEIKRVVATLHDRIMPYFWVSGGDQTDFETAFRADDTVQNIVAIDAVDDARLYRAEWTSNVETIVYAYVEVGATILEAIGRDGYWELRMRFDDHDRLSESASIATREESRLTSTRFKSKNNRWQAPSMILHQSKEKRWSGHSKRATTMYPRKRR